MEITIFTDFVNQLAFEAKKREIKILDQFHYMFGSFIKIQTDEAQGKEFLEDFDFLIEEHI